MTAQLQEVDSALIKNIEDEVTAQLQSGEINLRQLFELFNELHLAPGDEKDKLRKKDKQFIGVTTNLAGWMLFYQRRQLITQPVFHLFQHVLIGFGMIENILHELKGEEGPLPLPEHPVPSPPPLPPLPPNPGPNPGSGPSPPSPGPNPSPDPAPGPSPQPHPTPGSGGAET